ncbi:MAG: fluoride efflux transporter CrcB [Paracoccaceae bacterium]
MISTLTQVAIGGAVGALGRYLIGAVVAFPIGTLTVNILGSFLMGLAFVAMAEKGLDRWMPLVMTGVLGGFTTFSAFSLDVFRLYDAGRVGAAGGYVLASVALSLLALFIGIILMRGVQA